MPRAVRPAGEGDDCEMRGVQLLFGPDANTAAIDYSRVEDQDAVWEQAGRIGRLIGERLRAVAEG